MKLGKRIFLKLCVGLSFAITSLSGLTARAETISLDRLSEIKKLMNQQVKDKKIAGAVAMVSYHGETVFLEAIGKQDIEKNIDMDTNTIFRIASMTKPITSTAVMILYDRGLLKLDDPVSHFIPEFKNQTVLVGGKDRTETRPAKREMTIKHLLTHTSGLGTRSHSAVSPMYEATGISHCLLHYDSTLEEMMKKLGPIPLLYDPGDSWFYSIANDVLARIVEVVSGQSFKDFLQENVFNPLQMNDTCFFIPDDKLDRLATAYAPIPGGGIRPLGKELVVLGSFVYTAGLPYSDARKYYSGGGGLCSTISDYYRFAAMILNGGELEGKRVLNKETVQLMTQDHVGDLRKGEGWGFGFSVTRNKKEAHRSFGWGGFWYTTFFIDPNKELIGICMSQLHPREAELNNRFKGLVYKAIDK